MKNKNQIKKLTYFIYALGVLSACTSHINSPADQNVSVKKAINPPEKSQRIVDELTYDNKVIHFEGFGPAKFGDNEESVRIAWGRPLEADKPAIGSSCYNLYQTPASLKNIVFMFENNQFVRYDVKDSQLTAPGNIKVGNNVDAILQSNFANLIIQPHKYSKGARDFIVMPKAHKNTQLIFEVDAHNKITQWRIGVKPQVNYVEGCN